jgi:hypothetical protein
MGVRCTDGLGEGNPMKRPGKMAKNGTAGSKSPGTAHFQERRVPTPSPDLFVVRTGGSTGKVKVTQAGQAPNLVARVGKAMKKPGADRASIFLSTTRKPVFAYFIYSKDPTKVVREDAKGQQTIGRFVSGRFRAIRSADTN